MTESENTEAAIGSNVEADIEANIEADVAATLATIRALTEVQERLRTNFERERTKLVAERPARASKAKDERRRDASGGRTPFLRATRETLVRLVLLAASVGFLLIVFNQAMKLAKSINGVLAP